VLIATLLSPAAGFAQPDFPLEFDSPAHDFGRIREQDGRVSHTFGFVNRSDGPVVIVAVETTCGCTVPSFSKKPVLPGGRGSVTLTYDPEGRPGTFSRGADVYAAGRRAVARLKIEGEVEPRPRTVEENYPFDAGGGVRLSAEFVPFGYVGAGKPKQSSVRCVNVSNRPVAVELRPVGRSGALRVKAPHLLAPGAEGEIRMTYSASGMDDVGTADDEMRVLVDGEWHGGRLAANAVVVSVYDPDAEFPAPRAQLNKNIANFGTVNRSGGVRTVRMTLANLGGDPLKIDAVEADAPVSLSIGRGAEVGEGEEMEFDVRFDPSRAEYGYTTRRVRIFTSDPQRPMRQIRVTATVVDE